MLATVPTTTILSKDITEGTDLALTNGSVGTVERVSVTEFVVIVDLRVGGRPQTGMYRPDTALETA